MKQIDRRWETIEIGQLFAIPINDIELKDLRTKATYKGYKLKKKFKVVQYEMYYEVGRIA